LAFPRSGNAGFATSVDNAENHFLEVLPFFTNKVGFGVTSTSQNTATAVNLNAQRRPSAAVRPDFFAAFRQTLVRSQSTAGFHVGRLFQVNAFFLAVHHGRHQLCCAQFF